MASNLDTLITVFGGSGFLGRNVVRALAKRDYRIRIAVRRPELAGHLQPIGRVGQIHAVQTNLRYPASVAAAMRDSSIAINLVGILTESGAQTFDAVQARGAETIARAADAVDGMAKPGATYELGGPEVLTMREIMQWICKVTGRDRALLPLPFGLAKLQATFLQFAPGALKLTPDQVVMLQSDNVVSEAAKAAGLTLEGLGIAPDSMEAIAPQYLWRFRAAGQFQKKTV